MPTEALRIQIFGEVGAGEGRSHRVGRGGLVSLLSKHMDAEAGEWTFWGCIVKETLSERRREREEEGERERRGQITRAANMYHKGIVFPERGRQTQQNPDEHL